MVCVSCARIQTPDVGVVAQLARLHLCARRNGSELCFTDASEELVALIDLAGLGDVLRVEVRRKPEKREEPGRVEEERDLGDLSV
jgi:ABC-type transporter Mla MlaB component